jgi:hypothetical protein
MSVACLAGLNHLEDAASALTRAHFRALSEITVNAMSKRSLRNVETQKKKRRRAIPRAKVTRAQGNTAGARRRLKKLANQARGAKAAAKG